MSSRRRSGRSTDRGRRSALEEIRRLREGGDDDDEHDGEHEHEHDHGTSTNSRLASFQLQESSVFKTVTDEEYEELVRQRRSAVPFVENDEAALGYFDDGEEQFFESDEERQADQENENDDEDELRGKKRSAGALSSAYARRAKKLQRAKLGTRGEQKITNMFFSASNKSSGASGGGAVLKSGGRRGAKQEMDLDSMLDDLTSNPTEVRSTYARPVSYSSGSSFAVPDESSRAEWPRASLSGGLSPVEQQERSRARTEMERSRLEVEDDGKADDYDDDNGLDVGNGAEDDDDVDMQDATAGAAEERTEEARPRASAQQEAEEPTLTPAQSKRQVLLRRAREAQLQATAPTVKALTNASAPVVDQDEDMEKAANVPSNEVSEWWQAGGSSDPSVASATQSTDETMEPTVAGSSDSLQMYWMDAVEVRDRPGKLYLIGKIKAKTDAGETYKSCCVVVNNLDRYMYLIPRLSEEKDGSTLLKDLPKEKQQEHWMRMHEEIRRILIPSCITTLADQQRFQSKLVERDYAFEMADIPRGKQMYMKVKYPAKYPAPPSDICNRGASTFRRICGALTRPLENFLLRRRLLGPGWIEIKNVGKSKESVSFCSAEYETMDPKNVSALQGHGLRPPPLNVMSVSMKTFCNPSNGNHEIVALSAITERGVNSDGSSGRQRTQIAHFTTIRPLDANKPFARTYGEAALRDPRFNVPGQECLSVQQNERAVLSYFLTRIQVEDPDVIVGHNFHKYTLDLLISRVEHYCLGGLWSKLTRLRRGRLTPMNTGEGWNEYRMDDTVNGRLFVDTYVSAKEFLPSQSNYSLSFLVNKMLNKQRLEVEMADIPDILHGGPDNFVRFLRHTLDDSMFVLQLMHKLEVLPLTKQLAGLCGYMWTRTLEANKRAERIEYLLLHEFSRSKHKFIVPEKFGNKKTDGERGSRRREKASYAGGMVFAPKKGLYDNYVVVLDFMSLYPSIIREYNICFTTVDRQLIEDPALGTTSASSKKQQKKKKAKPAPAEQIENGDDDDVVDDQDAPEQAEESEIPPLPSSSCPDGILPAVIKRLLDSRRQVKQELKSAVKAGDMEKAAQLDIRQKAIKLTANSMYGCLGFRFSRFYAKPIAALITATGRQTLQRAREVAEQECGYDVIYGDTDSIMVDARSDQLEDARRIGREIQQHCNKHFRLLEIEIDYIFKAILLLNKKKYAALVVKERGNGEVVVEKEVKGLDMVRRDWCVISKAVGMEILDFILSGHARDDVVEQIHEHLEQIAARIRSGNEPIEQFVITKSLNKQPEQYPDRNKQYHVQVALALRAQGQPIGIGSHIPYVLCNEEEPGTGRRAYHPEEIHRAKGKLTIDIEWYLESQIHPPVNRLCAHIEGTSSPQLAHCLGLDTAKFAHTLTPFGADADAADAIPSVLQEDTERFQACTPLEIRCRRCQQQAPFAGVYQKGSDGVSWTSGLACVNPECRAEWWGYDHEGLFGNIGDDLQAVLSNRLHLVTRASVRKYYEAWVVCSDVTCRTRTQKQSLRGNGNICSAAGCRAVVALEYTDRALYTQLKYLASLFDIERAHKKIEQQQQQSGGSMVKFEAPLLSERQREVFKVLHSQAEQIVQQNDYNWVKPSLWQTLFV